MPVAERTDQDRDAAAYFMDIYHLPHDEGEPVLWRTTRIVAQNDAEAIQEAEASFRSST